MLEMKIYLSIDTVKAFNSVIKDYCVEQEIEWIQFFDNYLLFSNGERYAPNDFSGVFSSKYEIENYESFDDYLDSLKANDY